MTGMTPLRVQAQDRLAAADIRSLCPASATCMVKFLTPP